jgi:ATP-dependent Clp protease ATP-binding subunit ClpB
MSMETEKAGGQRKGIRLDDDDVPVVIAKPEPVVEPGTSTVTSVQREQAKSAVNVPPIASIPEARRAELFKQAMVSYQGVVAAAGKFAGTRVIQPEDLAAAILEARGVLTDERTKKLSDAAKVEDQAARGKVAVRALDIIVRAVWIAEQTKTKAGEQQLVRALELVTGACSSELVQGLAEADAKQVKATASTRVQAPVVSAASLERPLNFKVLNGKFAIDLVKKARDHGIDEVVHRDNEISAAGTVLQQRKTANIALVGEPGVGKTAILLGLALRIAQGKAPLGLENARILLISAAEFCARAGNNPAELVRKIVDDVRAARALTPSVRVILGTDELHSIMSNKLLVNELKPYLEDGTLQMAGATTIDEFRELQKDKAFERRFTAIDVRVPTDPEQVDMLLANIKSYEIFHGVDYDPSAAEASVAAQIHVKPKGKPSTALELLDNTGAYVKQQLSDDPPSLRHVKQRMSELQQIVNSAKSSDVLDAESQRTLQARTKELAKLNGEKTDLEALALVEKPILETLVALGEQLRVALNNAESPQEEIQKLRKGIEGERQKLADLPRRLYHWKVDGAAVYANVAQKTGLAVEKLQSGGDKKSTDVGAALSERVFGQPEAVAVVTSAVNNARAETNDENRPLLTSLWVGPTGVGKTELAQALADYLGVKLLRYDMNIYSEAHAVAAFVGGGVQGYVGYGPACLIDDVIANPNAVVLLDEVEKAHVSLWLKLMNVFDNGMIKSLDGQKNANFRKTFLVMTSNLAATEIMAYALQNGTYSDVEAVKEILMQARKAKLAPEINGRLAEEDVVIFRPLSDTVRVMIMNKEFGRIAAQQQKKGRTLEMTDEARQVLIKQGFSPEKGGRDLGQKLKAAVRNPLGMHISSGLFPEGSFVMLDAESGKLIFREMTDEEKALSLARSMRKSGTTQLRETLEPQPEPALAQTAPSATA